MERGKLQWLDVPPVWLLAFLAAAWGLSPGVAAAPWSWIGAALFWAGLGLIFWAAWVMVRARTTVIPHQRAAALVTQGPFAVSRNPIYLGDALILCGLLLRWDLAVLLPFAAFFIWIITRRFILGEEARLRQDFGQAFDAYCIRTRRWL